jgi:hypothetical protein
VVVDRRKAKLECADVKMRGIDGKTDKGLKKPFFRDKG